MSVREWASGSGSDLRRMHMHEQPDPEAGSMHVLDQGLACTIGEQERTLARTAEATRAPLGRTWHCCSEEGRCPSSVSLPDSCLSTRAHSREKAAERRENPIRWRRSIFLSVCIRVCEDLPLDGEAVVTR